MKICSKQNNLYIFSKIIKILKEKLLKPERVFMKLYAPNICLSLKKTRKLGCFTIQIAKVEKAQAVLQIFCSQGCFATQNAKVRKGR